MLTTASANGVRVNNGRKDFIVVNTFLLRITMAYPSSFVASKTTISMKLVTKNPFSRNNVGIRGTRNKLPSVIFKQGIKFVFHGGSPMRIKKSGFIGFRYRRKIRINM
jgi:hypothetical protein